MKYLLSFSCAVLLITVLVSVIPVSGEERIYENMIRLHVVAASDSEKDQRIKLAVRDRIIEKISAYTEGIRDTDAAYGKIEELLPAICKAANEVLEEKGTQDRATVSIGEELYPERVYEDFTLPAGKYISLKITIGDGGGQNWWCILFPPLCTAASVKSGGDDSESEELFVEAGISTEGYRMIKNERNPKYAVRFRILEIFSGIFGYQY